jgi:chitodextrinase
MNSKNSVDWVSLLEASKTTRNVMERWSNEELTSDAAKTRLTSSASKAAFRNLMKSHGTMYGRRLARKALKYRGITV